MTARAGTALIAAQCKFSPSVNMQSLTSRGMTLVQTITDNRDRIDRIDDKFRELTTVVKSLDDRLTHHLDNINKNTVQPSVWIDRRSSTTTGSSSRLRLSSMDEGLNLPVKENKCCSVL